MLSKGLAACTGLRSVEVAVSFDFSPKENTPYIYDAWHCLADVLAYVPSSTQTLGLQLSADNWDASLEELSLDWQPVRAALQRMNKLETLTVATVPTGDSVWFFTREEKELVARHLDAWDEKGVLHVE